MKTNTKTLVFAALLLTIPNYAFAGSVAGTGGATEVTQLLNRAQLVLSYAKQVQQYEAELNSMVQDIRHTEMMLQNLVQLPAATWSKFENDALQLKGIVQQGQAISFAAANLDSQFAATYKGYASYEASAAGSLDDRTTTFKQQYKNLNASTRDSVNGALKSLNTQMSAMNSDEAVMNTLESQSRSADGQLKAVQAANEIAMHQTDTLKKLQFTLMTQASTEAGWISKQNEEKTAQDALSNRRTSTHKTNKTDNSSLTNFFN